jgi:hypothetical protein
LSELCHPAICSQGGLGPALRTHRGPLSRGSLRAVRTPPLSGDRATRVSRSAIGFPRAEHCAAARGRGLPVRDRPRPRSRPLVAARITGDGRDDFGLRLSTSTSTATRTASSSAGTIRHRRRRSSICRWRVGQSSPGRRTTLRWSIAWSISSGARCPRCARHLRARACNRPGGR